MAICAAGSSPDVKPGGTLYFSVPIGRKQRVEFDGQRVFSLPYLMDELVKPLCFVKDFARIDDAGGVPPSCESP